VLLDITVKRFGNVSPSLCQTATILALPKETSVDVNRFSPVWHQVLCRRIATWLEFLQDVQDCAVCSEMVRPRQAGFF